MRSGAGDWQLLVTHHLLKARPVGKKPTSRCLCGALVRSCSWVLSTDVCGFRNALIRRFAPFILGRWGRAQSALEIYPKSPTISFLYHLNISFSINICTSDLILKTNQKQHVLLTKMSSYEMLNKFLQNDHICIFRSMYPGERCLTGEKKISFPTQRFQSLSSRGSDTLEGYGTLWKEPTDRTDNNLERFQGPLWAHASHLIYLANILLPAIGYRIHFFLLVNLL